jgi:putative glutamine amidotransferase
VAEKDGVIEAIRHEQFPWEGWMWHPEREEVFNMIDTLRMKRLLGEKD